MFIAKPRPFLLIILFFLVTSFEVLGKSRIRACFTHWPPFSYIENGSPAGLSIEIYKTALKKANIEVEFQFQPWKRCRMQVSKGSVDAAVDGGTGIDGTIFGKKRPVLWVISFWVKEVSNYRNFTSYSQFEGRTVVHVRGYGYPKEFEDYVRFSKKVVSSDTQGLKILAARKVDAFIGDLINNTLLVKQNKIKVRPLSPAVDFQTLTLVFNKSRKKQHQLFESALNEMFLDGTVDAIYKKHLGTSYRNLVSKYQYTTK